MSTAYEEDAPPWARNTGNLDVEDAVRGLVPPLSSDREGYLEDAFFGIDDIDDIDAPLTLGELSLPSSSIDGSGLFRCRQYDDDASFNEFLDEHFVNKPYYHPEKKPSALEPAAAVADAEASPSVPECPYAEKGCSRCRDKNPKGTGTSLFFMARDKDFSSKIDAGEKESLFLEGKGSICFPKKSRDGAWDGCFCKFVKMILGVPIRNKNNGTYYDQFKVNGNVRRECFDENGQVTGSRVLWNAFHKFVWFDYLPALEDDIRPPRPRAPKELKSKRREEVKRVIDWLKLVDEAHQRGESTMKEELDGFFQSLHDLKSIHEERIAEEKRVTNAQKFLFVHAFRQFFGSDVTGRIGYFADDRLRHRENRVSSWLLHARPSNAFVLQADAKRRRLEQHDVRGLVKDPDFLGAQAFESPQQTLQQT